MTLAKRTLYFVLSLMLAGAISVAQTAVGGSSQDQDSSMAGQAAGAKLRGCLSGSSDNYTLTDHNGAIYHLVGGDAQLQNAVGHEVEITGTPDARGSGVADDSAANTASSFQVTGVHELGARCDHGSGTTGTMDNNSRPMTERLPSTDHQPKGAPGEGVPPQPQPQPELIAMLQQPGSTDMSAASQQSNTNATMGTATTSEGQASQGAVSTGGGPAPGASPAVTSQTPAQPQSPVDSNSQRGAGTTDQTPVPSAAGTTASPGMATTKQPGTSPNGSTGATSQTAASAGSTAAPTGTTANPTTAASPQTHQDDANKPLYERQATDVPWANGSGSSTTTTSPNGSSTTTTTTTPEPHR